jgi:site-specific recombinase XerD
MYDLDILIRQGEEYLRALDYSQSSLRHYACAWRRLRSWYGDSGYKIYDKEAQGRYFADAGLDAAGLSKHRRSERAFVEFLIALAETGRPPQRTAHVKHIIPKGFESAFAEYKDELVRRNLKPSTVCGYVSVARCFFANCEEASPGDLTVRSVARFAQSIEGCAPQTRSAKLYVVRNVIGFLANRGECSKSVAECMPLIPGHKHSATPSAYTCAEVSSILTGKGQLGSHLRPKRDRAIMLLAGILGMRISDIKALRLQDIDWHSKTMSLIQSKTQVSLVLPMPDEVWLALADYLRYERPSVDSDRIFITACAPYHPIDSSHTFHRALSRAFAAAGIDTAGKHHGMHSLRHSVATNMLADGVPYPTISATLGHSSTNVTKRYLSIDVEALRPIALEVPRCKK